MPTEKSLFQLLQDFEIASALLQQAEKNPTAYTATQLKKLTQVYDYLNAELDRNLNSIADNAQL